MIATTSDYIKLHFIVFLWGFTAVLGKLVSLPAVEMVFYRTVLAALGMAVLIIAMRGSFRISKSDFIKIALTGFIVAIHWITFFGSGRISNPSTSLVGFATCSFWAALIEPLAKRKKIQLLDIALGIVVMIGLSIIFAGDFKYPLGLFLGIISGLTAAIFSVINSKLVVRVNANTITFYEMVSASLIIFLFFPIYQNTWADNNQLNLTPYFADWIYIAILAWVCSVYAYSVAINLTKRLSVFFIQLALNLEPLYGIALALIIFGDKEVMSGKFYIGTFIIICAVGVYPFIKKRTEFQFKKSDQ